MASNFFFFNLFLFLFSTCVAINNNVTSTKPPLIAPDAFCNSTLYPNFCKSILPHDKPCNLHDSAQFSIRRSLSSARKFLRLIDKYLKHRSKLTKSAMRALEDCRLLSALNIDFLSTTFMSLNSTNPFLSFETEDLQTMLSAIVTNHQTCLDGIQATASAWSLRNEIYYPLSNGTKLYSVSLALFTQGWVHKKKKKCKCLKKRSERKLLFSDMEVVEVHGRLVLPLRMSRRNRKIFERVSRSRTLLVDEEEDSSVLVSDIAVVNPNGSENFATITDAVAAAPNNSNSSTDGFFLIYIVGGVYEEYVSIGKNKKNLMMIGDGINQTVITGNRSFVDGWTTFNSATFAVVGEGFVAIDMTFQNTAGAIKHQAVAVRNGADLSTFYRCSFEGYQDTLYAHSLRQFYRECDIYGTVDFIFGNAAVVFQNCNIYAKLPMPNQFNSITAQGRTDPNQNTGTAIHNCSILAAPDLRVALRNGTTTTKTKTYLGRPWKEYSRTVYMQSFIDGFIEPSGWSPWLGDFALRTLYYGEYNNTGKGSNTKKRVGWSGYHVIVTATDAANFTVSNLISGDDWLPATGIYYLSGLLRTK